MATTIADDSFQSTAGFPIDPLLEQELDQLGVKFTRVRELPLSQVRVRDGAQVRKPGHRAPPQQVERYATQMRSGANFPAIVVSDDPDEPEFKNLDDGNTRLAAAQSKQVQRDTFPAYVLHNVRFDQCRELGVYLNQRNGRELDKEETLTWIRDALEQKMSLTRIARISGFKLDTIKKMNGAYEFDTRAKELALPQQVFALPQSAKAHIAEDIQHDAVFSATAKLAADAAVPVAELTPLTKALKKTRTDDEALHKIDEERKSRQTVIEQRAEATTNGTPVPRPPYSIQMIKHLRWVIERDPLDLFERSPATRAEAEQLLSAARARLSDALEVYQNQLLKGQEVAA